MTKRALVIVDLQNDYFPNGKWTLEGTDAAADNAAKVLADARARGDLVVHVRHEAKEADAPFFVAGSEGAAIHKKVINQGNEPVVTKNHINSFRETNLQSILDKNGVKEVIVAGAMSHMCVDGITRAAVDLGYDTTVIHDACATLDLEFNGVTVPAKQVHAAFMSALGFGYATLRSTKDYLADAR